MVLIGLKEHLNLMKISEKTIIKIARYFIEANVQYPEKLYELHNPKRMKIEKLEKLVANLHDEKE